MVGILRGVGGEDVEVREGPRLDLGDLGGCSCPHGRTRRESGLACLAGGVAFTTKAVLACVLRFLKRCRICLSLSLMPRVGSGVVGCVVGQSGRWAVGTEMANWWGRTVPSTIGSPQ